MNRRTATQRARGAALAGAVCLLAACATGPGRPGAGSGAALDPAAAQRADALAHFAAGVSAQYAGAPDRALDHYRQSLALDPRNVAEAVQLANILITRKEFDEALAVLEQAARLNPKNAEAAFWLGMTARAADRTEQAIESFRRALQLDPKQITAVQALLEIYFQQKATTEIARLFDHAWDQQSDDARYWLRLGDLQVVALRQLPELEPLIDKKRIEECYVWAGAHAPTDPEIQLRLAQWYETNNETKEAAAAYQRVLELRPEEAARLRFKLAGLYTRADEREQAVAELEALVKLDPLRFEVYNFLGELYEGLDQADKAVQSYQQSLVVNPNQIQPYLQIAMLQQQRKQYAEAHRVLARAKEKFPTDYRVPYILGLLYSDQKKYAEAVATFTDAETIATEAPDGRQPDGTFYFWYGSACERAGDLTKAALLFRRCIELDPDQHRAYNYLGYMWAEKGVNLAEARKLIETAVSEDPDNAAYLDSLGWVLFKQGHNQEALTHLRRAVDLMKDDTTILDHLVDILLALGRKQEAIGHLRRAHELEPDNQAITDKLRKLAGDNAAATPAK
ncbi:tetratricopeptide repeat protein [bacterium]|nr:tetratricopeptide repeat protein [bacterium]